MLPHPPWRTDVSAALAVVAGQPSLWLVGALGFMLRGGIVFLLLPIIVLPTQVEVRLALGSNLGSSGLTSEFWTLVTAGTVISSVVLIVALFVLARIELLAFSRLVADADSAEHRSWQPAAGPTAGQRRALVTRLFMVHALAVLGLGIAAYPLAAAIGQATLDEILRPSSSAAIYLRVLEEVRAPLVMFGAAIVIVEMLSAGATRQLLIRQAGLGAPLPRRRPLLVTALVAALAAVLRSPGRTLATAVLCWLLTLAALVVLTWALGIAWAAARASFLATTSLAEIDGGLLVVALLLAAVFAGCVLVTGFVSAVRAALWTMTGLR